MIALCPRVFGTLCLCSLAQTHQDITTSFSTEFGLETQGGEVGFLPEDMIFSLSSYNSDNTFVKHL